MAGCVPEAASAPDSLIVRISESAISASLFAQIFIQQISCSGHSFHRNHAESALKAGHNPREHLAFEFSTARKQKTQSSHRAYSTMYHITSLSKENSQFGPNSIINSHFIGPLFPNVRMQAS